MKGSCIIFFHGNDWTGTPARQKYLMQALSCHVPVIYLDGGADQRGHITVTRPLENVTVVRGLISLMVALQRHRLHPLLTVVANWYVGYLTRGFERIIFWNAENLVRPYRFIRHHTLVFDCIDPAFVDDPNDYEALALHEVREELILGDADLVFATADSLAENCRRNHHRVFLLNNACEPTEYEASLVATATQPLWWPATRSSVAAYLGTLDWRIDFALLEQVCHANPDVYFIVAGYMLPQYEPQKARLSALPNVICPGKISIADGRYLLANCTFGLIPFVPGAMNDAINPVKMYAYALLGKPIVGSCIHELRIRSNIVITASAAEDYSQAMKKATAQSTDAAIQERLKAFALENTWRVRADQAWTILKDI